MSRAELLEIFTQRQSISYPKFATNKYDRKLKKLRVFQALM